MWLYFCGSSFESFSFYSFVYLEAQRVLFCFIMKLLMCNNFSDYILGLSLLGEFFHYRLCSFGTFQDLYNPRVAISSAFTPKRCVDMMLAYSTSNVPVKCATWPSFLSPDISGLWEYPMLQKSRAQQSHKF